MNYVRVLGGLGNQMFQYTMAKYIEASTSSSITLHLNYFEDVKKVPGAVIRKFDLDKMNTTYLSVYGNLSVGQLINEWDAWSIRPDLDSVYFNGYWQDKKYYLAVKETIDKDFELKKEYITDSMVSDAEKMHSSKAVSLHIRRTDYLIESITMDNMYYSNALNILKERVGHDLEVFIFSDDIDYAEGLARRLEIETFYIMPIREAYQDIYLMSQTKHHVIANSTFSWWGAVLGNAKNCRGITVAPKKWFKDGTAPDIFMDDWFVI